MFDEIPLIYWQLTVAAFAAGWLLAKVGTFLKNRSRAPERDPRDNRILSMQAEQRVAKSESERNNQQIEVLQKAQKEAENEAAERKQAMDDQFKKIVQLREDLKDSVRKTRELRGELRDRATETVRSEVKLREVETELEVTRASADMIATGVLDYSMAPDAEGDAKPKVSKTAT